MFSTNWSAQLEFPFPIARRNTTTSFSSRLGFCIRNPQVWFNLSHSYSPKKTLDEMENNGVANSFLNNSCFDLINNLRASNQVTHTYSRKKRIASFLLEIAATARRDHNCKKGSRNWQKISRINCKREEFVVDAKMYLDICWIHSGFAVMRKKERVSKKKIKLTQRSAMMMLRGERCCIVRCMMWEKKEKNRKCKNCIPLRCSCLKRTFQTFFSSCLFAKKKMYISPNIRSSLIASALRSSRSLNIAARRRFQSIAIVFFPRFLSNKLNSQSE